MSTFDTSEPFNPEEFKMAKALGPKVTMSDGNQSMQVAAEDAEYLASLGWVQVGGVSRPAVDEGGSLR